MVWASAAAALQGCGAGSPPPVVQASQADVDKVVKMRTIFVNAKGNYDSLSASDKATYNQLAGGESAGQKEWQVMSKNPVDGTAPSSSTTHGP